MKIAIDATRAIIEKAGIGRVTKELTENLLKIDQKNQYLLIFSYFSDDPEKIKQIKEFEKFKNVKTKVIKIPGKIKEVLWLSKLPYLKKLVEDADVFFAPSCFESNFSIKIPQAVIIYDLTTFLFPEQQGNARSKFFNQRIRLAVEKSDKVIAISQSTKNDLIKILKTPEEKIEVVYCGLADFKKISDDLPEGLKEKSYVLAVGTIEPRKNLANLFRAYGKLENDVQKKFPLVIVGAKGWNTGETYKVLSEENLIDKVKFLGYQPDDVLAKLYKEAKVFVYPSLYEGFGLPIAEALKLGTPVICSNTSSMPEAGGKAATLIDPKNPESIYSAIKNHLENKINIDARKKIGYEHVKQFSWDIAAKKVQNILEQLNKN